MKKIYYLLFLILAAGLFLPVPALALTEMVSLFQIGNNEFYLDGQQYEMDVAPFIKDGRTFIPVRYLANSIGISNENIEWDDRSSKVTLTKGNSRVELVIGKPEMYVNGVSQAIDAAPLFKDGRVFLPARYIADVFKYSVGWNEKKALISIDKEQVVWDTKQYNDTENHFGLEYPLNWKAAKTGVLSIVLVITSPPEDCNDDFSENILVQHLKDPSVKNMTLDQLVDTTVQNQRSSLPRFDVYKAENGYVDGVPAKYIKARCNNGKTDYCIDQIFAKVQDECFVINFSVKEDKVGLYDKVLYILVNSFEILDEARKALPTGAAEYSGDWGKPDSEGLIHPNGKGKLTYTNGDEYQGDFENGQKHGYGCYTWENQDSYSGEWKNDLKDGEGTLIYFDANSYWQLKSGIWQNDQFIKETEFKNRLEPIDKNVGP